jgi:ATP-dependent helicase/nuclease subunit A
MSGHVYPLRGEQARAVEPRDSVWLSASAGTGKTQVLSARVLRLLLRREVEPGQILCLTFTKAGAAEMATRVNEVLANWVRMKPEPLAAALKAIGAPFDPETQARARTLFASVLDCPGGGLRIDTIHAFSQWLLANFPEEAGLVPGTRPMEDRDRDLLAHKVLAELLVEAEERGDVRFLDTLAALSIRMGPDGARGWLMRCAEAREVWFGPGAWQHDLAGRVHALLGLDPDEDEASLARMCADEGFDCDSLRNCLATLSGWDTKSGRESAAAIDSWLAADPQGRLATLDSFFGTLFTKDKARPKNLNHLEKRDSAYEQCALRVLEAINVVHERRSTIALAKWLVPALQAGRAFALAWDAAKEREGLIDFDDQIRRAAALLTRSELAGWIRYKLDRRFDHILIDEAQDTNEAQWSIIRALTEDFFAGQGQREDRLRTIFVVGDYKQAIFRFQGTSPENFESARQAFAQRMRALAQNDPDARPLQELGLGRSYRSAQPVLDFVDDAIEAVGASAFGLTGSPGEHAGEARPGLVALWQPVSARADEDDEDEGPETWLSEPERRMADRIAAQVKQWLDDGFPLVKGRERNAGPGDIMVLVRKRRELAGLIVARLYAAGVPVAGVDRLRLGAPLAVKDLMAALRFAVQPNDDLSLANLLVSPLCGWSQEELLAHGWRPKNRPLWDHLRDSAAPRATETVDALRELLRRADWEPPQALLHWILTGPWNGRRSLVARLGREANDPIDELLNAASAISATHVPSLQAFITWFDAGEGELKREAGAADGLVRVMTVHGSKGLQSPIVILADATGNPDSSPIRELILEEQLPAGGGRTLPLPSLRGEEKVGRIAEAEEAARIADRQEHWRLMYVAMTRAEEALFIGGALGKRESEPAADSWFARLAPLFDCQPIEDPIWGWRLERGEQAAPVARAAPDTAPSPIALPAWAIAPIGPEPRPPRPLAPSSAGRDPGSDPPLPPEAGREAARRGVLIHRLLERLPEVRPEMRATAAAEWLGRQGRDLTADQRAEIARAALAVLADPAFAEVFSPQGLAEVSLAATVNGQVIAGSADRLLVTATRVTVVDFKTARRPPAALAEVPLSTLRQMAAYAAALEAIYPGREIVAAVLYTHTPQLIQIPAEVLALHKSGLSGASESFVPPPVE